MQTTSMESSKWEMCRWIKKMYQTKYQEHQACGLVYACIGVKSTKEMSSKEDVTRDISQVG